MSDDQRVVLFIFAGREDNMRIQRPYLDRLLSEWPGLTVEVWNLTRNDHDDAYVRGLHDPDGRVIVRNDLHQGPNDWPIACRKRAVRPRWCGCPDCRPAPFEQVYRWYAERPDYADATFVKMDDDIVFIDTARFGDFLAELDAHPTAVVSASVVNNVVSAKHLPELRELVEREFRDLPTQRAWFDLHADDDFARVCHDWFLQNWPRVIADDYPPTRALPGERPSINVIAFTWETMGRLWSVMSSPRFARMGDEGSVCQNFLPRIVRGFTCAHLYFGPQRVRMTDEETDAYRARYAELSRLYLTPDEAETA